ncbi:hypothetical protein CLW00_103261 [Mongoliibacter ruber]|uniref:Uncharacterized protein n=1 Tax=Mongoliibacter ruber TaxID=1750599 RepID=A0A2T0WR09_9BACT|nr:hypothetical protein CLW00_103261 [Mongoliibacter ruber]
MKSILSVAGWYYMKDIKYDALPRDSYRGYEG